MAEGVKNFLRDAFLGKRTPLDQITPAKLAETIAGNQAPTRLDRRNWKPVSVEAAMRNLNLSGIRIGEKPAPGVEEKVGLCIQDLVDQGVLEDTNDGYFQVRDPKRLRALAEQAKKKG